MSQLRNLENENEYSMELKNYKEWVDKHKKYLYAADIAMGLGFGGFILSLSDPQYTAFLDLSSIVATTGAVTRGAEGFIHWIYHPKNKDLVDRIMPGF